MVDPSNTSGERKSDLFDLFALAVTLILGALSLLRAEIPRIALALLIFGCLMLSLLTWKATGEWRGRFRGLFRIVIVVVVLSLSIYLSWRVYPVKRPESTPANQPLAKPTSTFAKALGVQQRKEPILQEVTVFLYNDANDPQFSVDGTPTRPTQYSSGIATFHLPDGTHLIRAEYPTRMCSATVSVPLSEPRPVAANCSLKKTGGD